MFDFFAANLQNYAISSSTLGDFLCNYVVSLNSKFSCSKSKLKKRFEKGLLFSSCKCMPSNLPFSVIPLHRVQIVIFFIVNKFDLLLFVLFVQVSRFLLFCSTHIFTYSYNIKLLFIVCILCFSLILYHPLFLFSLFASFVYFSLCLYCQHSILFIEMNSALSTLNYIYMLYAINIFNNSNLQFYCIIFKNCLCFFFA